MKNTSIECSDPAVLRNRITVTDNELMHLLGMGKSASRAFAESCGAVFFIGGRRVTSVAKILRAVEDATP